MMFEFKSLDGCDSVPDEGAISLGPSWKDETQSCRILKVRRGRRVWRWLVRVWK